eukprot:2302076-Pleurochrysis_carterae.AAC.1
MVPFFIHSRRPTYAGAHGVRTRQNRATERHLPISGQVLYLMFAFSAEKAIHGPESALVLAYGLLFPGETADTVELKQFLHSFQDAMD